MEFDEGVGLGVLSCPDGTRYPFHCTAIADGSRVIPVGTQVTFRLLAAAPGATRRPTSWSAERCALSGLGWCRRPVVRGGAEGTHDGAQAPWSP
ncbi:MAG: hypothetical protein M5U19_04735 [Microthrixaceae bacterium]|nr:hypothetical protein [Microthrixaceae bacterium]